MTLTVMHPKTYEALQQTDVGRKWIELMKQGSQPMKSVVDIGTIISGATQVMEQCGGLESTPYTLDCGEVMALCTLADWAIALEESLDYAPFNDGDRDRLRTALRQFRYDGNLI